jgi:hypothetical protein
MQVWGVQNDHPDLDLIGNGYVSLGVRAGLHPVDAHANRAA